MAGLVPAIHVFLGKVKQDVDARDKRGHDESNIERIGLVEPGLYRGSWCYDRSQLRVGQKVSPPYKVPQGFNAALGYDVIEMIVE
jgi:hypothetical protein